MKIVILAGGRGTRLSEETTAKPKPMVEIGGKPILWHIMNLYASFYFNEFIIALGYKGDIIADYFSAKHELLHNETGSAWNLHLIDTGLDTMTGGRLKRLKDAIGRETFMLTYGDGVANVNISELLKFHGSHGKIATITAVRPIARFGRLNIEGDRVKEFKEKAQTEEGWINGGFFVFEPDIFDYIDGDSTMLEAKPLENLAADNQLMAFRHEGFWQCMDTLRDKQLLDELWEKEKAPWKVWAHGKK